MNPQTPDPFSNAAEPPSPSKGRKLYENRCGIDELQYSRWLLSFGAIFWLEARFPGNPLKNGSFTHFLALFVAMCASDYGLDRLRERLIARPAKCVVPEGRVEVSLASMAIRLSIMLLVAAIPVYTLAHFRADFDPREVMVALANAAFYAWCFARRLRWKQLVAGLLAVGGVVMAIQPTPLDWWRMTLFSTLAGLLSGGISLWQHLNNTTPRPREAE